MGEPRTVSRIKRKADLPPAILATLNACREYPPTRETLQRLRKAGIGWALLCTHFGVTRGRLDQIWAGRRQITICPHCGKAP